MTRNERRELARHRVAVRMGLEAPRIQMERGGSGIDDLTAWAVVLLMCVGMSALMVVLNAAGVC